MLLLGGCVTKKYQAASAVGAVPLHMDFDLGGEPVNTRLDSVIVYQGPGTWKRAAYWDEFQVTLVNKSDKEITVTAINLVDYAGASIRRHQPLAPRKGQFGATRPLHAGRN